MPRVVGSWLDGRGGTKPASLSHPLQTGVGDALIMVRGAGRLGSKRMKKVVGRLGALAAAAGLVTTGLVGIATSASGTNHEIDCAYHVATTGQTSAAGQAEFACRRALAEQIPDYSGVVVTERAQDGGNGKTLWTATIPSDTSGVDPTRLPAAGGPLQAGMTRPRRLRRPRRSLRARRRHQPPLHHRRRSRTQMPRPD